MKSWFRACPRLAPGSGFGSVSEQTTLANGVEPRANSRPGLAPPGRNPSRGSDTRAGSSTKLRPHRDLPVGAQFAFSRYPSRSVRRETAGQFRLAHSGAGRFAGSLAGLPEPAQETDGSIVRLRSGPRLLPLYRMDCSSTVTGCPCGACFRVMCGASLRTHIVAVVGPVSSTL